MKIKEIGQQVIKLIAKTIVFKTKINPISNKTVISMKIIKILLTHKIQLVVTLLLYPNNQNTILIGIIHLMNILVTKAKKKILIIIVIILARSRQMIKQLKDLNIKALKKRKIQIKI